MVTASPTPAWSRFARAAAAFLVLSSVVVTCPVRLSVTAAAR
jgi:hypothetical protein